MINLKPYLLLCLGVISCQCFAAPWELLHDDPEMTIEWDRGNVNDYDGRKAVRKRISWKKAQVMDSGIKFKFTVQLFLYSCKDKTESMVAISNFSADRKLVYKADIGPIVQRSHSYMGNKDYNDVQLMLKKVC